MRGAPPCGATPGSRNQPGKRRRDPQADPEGPEAVTSPSPLRGQRETEALGVGILQGCKQSWGMGKGREG